MELSAKKSLGQNFLTNKRIIEHYLNKTSYELYENILEIGPGKGDMTELLLIDKEKKITAVELDDRAINILNSKFDGNKNFKLIHADITEWNHKKYYKNKDYIIIANIPFYITGLILRTFLESKHSPREMSLIVQHEIAARICDKKKESILSLSVKLFGEPKNEGLIRRGNFVPAPNVDAAWLSIKNITKDRIIDDNFVAFYFKIIKQCFLHKRKQLFTTLDNDYHENVNIFFNNNNIKLTVRPEELPFKTWYTLIVFLYTQK